MPQGPGTYGNKVGRPAEARKGMKVIKNPKVKGVSTEGLTKRQADTLKRHSKHHTSKHIKAMVNAMLKGSTFSQSHKKAQKSVGS
tara:strand:- start:23441 stop:23695 length:255 start_codon:yes stop_codon:yes gene_type:complete